MVCAPCVAPSPTFCTEASTSTVAPGGAVRCSPWSHGTRSSTLPDPAKLHINLNSGLRRCSRTQKVNATIAATYATTPNTAPAWSIVASGTGRASTNPTRRPPSRPRPDGSALRRCPSPPVASGAMPLSWETPHPGLGPTLGYDADGVLVARVRRVRNAWHGWYDTAGLDRPAGRRTGSRRGAPGGHVGVARRGAGGHGPLPRPPPRQRVSGPDALPPPAGGPGAACSARGAARCYGAVSGTLHSSGVRPTSCARRGWPAPGSGLPRARPPPPVPPGRPPAGRPCSPNTSS